MLNKGIAMCAGNMVMNALKPTHAIKPNTFVHIPRTLGAGALGTVIGMLFSKATSSVTFTLVENNQSMNSSSSNGNDEKQLSAYQSNAVIDSGFKEEP